MQVLSPSRQAVGYPFLFAPASHHAPLFTMQDNEKFRKLMQKKQKRWVMEMAIRYRRYCRSLRSFARRDSRKDKNVLSVFKAEDVEGHKFEDLDEVLKVGWRRKFWLTIISSSLAIIDPLLQSLGEEGGVEKKGKVKKTKDKVERVKVDKKEKGRRSVEKDVFDEEGVIEADDTTGTAETEAAPVVTVVKKVAVTKKPDLVTKGLTDFQDNFNLISSPGNCPGLHTYCMSPTR